MLGAYFKNKFMKITKIEDHYFLMTETVIQEGDYTWNGQVMYKMIKNLSIPLKGWKVVASTDYYEELARMNVNDIEKPVQTQFTPSDMVRYSNWVLEWCSTNKYRKTLTGVSPFGLGDTFTDEQLFNMYMDSLKVVQTEWNDVEAELIDNQVVIIKL
jgi:hypothetical protein